MKREMYRIKIYTKEVGRLLWDICAEDENGAREWLESEKKILTDTLKMTVTDAIIMNPTGTRKARQRDCNATKRRLSTYGL